MNLTNCIKPYNKSKNKNLKPCIKPNAHTVTFTAINILQLTNCAHYQLNEEEQEDTATATVAGNEVVALNYC
ncbi:hypothetical protein DOY81_005882 [Sarcophaga bullata]|nr:hypothetical protein DOY81_005882 [Sarcophaga bullata]